jgi:hypothetical protein
MPSDLPLIIQKLIVAMRVAAVAVEARIFIDDCASPT